MRILITGAGGQLGRDLATTCTAAGDDVVALARRELDLSDPASIATAIDEAQPDVVVNCAAWTAVDACEDDPARAELVNGTAVGQLHRASERCGAHLVQISTDYVFDGTKDEPYLEHDAPNPQSAYGRSKLLGETLAGPSSTVIRTSWVFSRHGGNMVETVLRLAADHAMLRFVDDQRGNPTHTADLAVAVRNLAIERPTGIFHVTNHPSVSWFEFARSVLQAADLDPERVQPIATDAMPRPATRPANSVLDNGRYHSLGHAPLPDFREALASIVPELVGSAGR